MATDTKLQELVINTMTKAQYDALATKDPNGIYAVTDAKTGARDLDTTNDGAAGQILTKTDDGMEWANAAAGDSLPEQTGHTGFLQTDGTNATWSDKSPLINNEKFSGNTGVGVGGYATSWGVSVGNDSNASYRGVAIGHNAKAGADAVVIGYYANNTEAKTIKFKFVGDASEKTLIQPDGTIPPERLAAAGTKEIMATASMPSGNSTSLTVGAHGSYYTAPADGWFVLYLTGGGTTNATIGLHNAENNVGNMAYVSDTSGSFYVSVPVARDQRVQAYHYSQDASVIKLSFVYANGASIGG